MNRRLTTCILATAAVLTSGAILRAGDMSTRYGSACCGPACTCSPMCGSSACDCPAYHTYPPYFGAPTPYEMPAWGYANRCVCRPCYQSNGCPAPPVCGQVSGWMATLKPVALPARATAPAAPAPAGK